MRLTDRCPEDLRVWKPRRATYRVTIGVQRLTVFDPEPIPLVTTQAHKEIIGPAVLFCQKSADASPVLSKPRRILRLRFVVC